MTNYNQTYVNDRMQADIILSSLPSSQVRYRGKKQVAFKPSYEILHQDASDSATVDSEEETTEEEEIEEETLDENTPTTIPGQDRFSLFAGHDTSLGEPCHMWIDGRGLLDVTEWAKAHPGGFKVLRDYHNKNATEAFVNAGHSRRAWAMLGRFEVLEKDTSSKKKPTPKSSRLVPARLQKLFTHEDPYGMHKALGIYCLCNFFYRYALMFLGIDGGAYLAVNAPTSILYTLVPHACLSLSSLIFHSVPRERVVGQPMMWKEFRMHSIIFGVRSVVCAAMAALSQYFGHVEPIRTVAVWTTGATVLGALIASSIATKYLEPGRTESTTATMPYWKGCSIVTQKRFKNGYAFAQFAATMGCLMVTNPAWPLVILFPIQGAALLLTMVRKGYLTPRGYHMLYAGQLLSVLVVGVWVNLVAPSSPTMESKSSKGLPIDTILMVLFSIGSFMLRRRGVNKYIIWIPIVVLRVVWGDLVINYQAWAKP